MTCVPEDLEQLYKEAHAYADLSSRPSPTPLDLIRACDWQRLYLNTLKKTVHKASRKRKLGGRCVMHV